MNLTNDYKAQTLEDARCRYGYRNQIGVAIEELGELICALSKFTRYDTAQEAIANTEAAVLDEFADVTIVLEHVRDIFNFTDDEIHVAQRKKIDRLERWLQSDKTESMRITTEDRKVGSEEHPALEAVKALNSMPVAFETHCINCTKLFDTCRPPECPLKWPKKPDNKWQDLDCQSCPHGYWDNPEHINREVCRKCKPKNNR